MASIDDVARHAGVSTATVSRVLNNTRTVSEKTTEKVLNAVAELDYVMSSSASGLASGRTKNIGVVVPELTRWYFTNVVEGVESALLEHGYDLTLYSLNDGGASRQSVFSHFLLRQRVDAVIAISQELTDDELARLRALNKPLVGVGGPLPGVPTLSIDDVAVARQATEHLISLGHTRIAHISGTVEFEADFHLPTNRRAGFEGALSDAGIKLNERLLGSADFTIPGGYTAAMTLLKDADHLPTAIFAASDEMAIGCLLAAKDHNIRVPEELSVIGVDNHSLSEFFGLTTIGQSPHQQGRQAVDILMQALGSDHPSEENINTTLKTELILRASTSQAPPIDWNR